jgi:hypothetical protein
MNPRLAIAVAVIALGALSTASRADPLGQVFAATIVGIDSSPALTIASQEAPLAVKLRFDNNQCWAVADVAPLAGKTINNVSGRLRGVECSDGRMKDKRGFVAGYLDASAAAKPVANATAEASETSEPTRSALWVAVFN